MVFKSEEELKDFVLAKCKRAIGKTQEEVHKILDIFMQRFYDEYDPIKYIRTEKFLHSLVKSDVRQNGNKIETEVYFDLGYAYSTGAKPSGEQVMQAAEWGRHGAMGLAVADFKGTSVWHESLAVLDAKAIDILKQMLIDEGIPIK